MVCLFQNYVPLFFHANKQIHVIGGITMPKAKRKHSDTSTDFIAFDELLTKANKKIKTPPVTSHEFDSHSKDDALTLLEDEKQLVNELASVIPNSPEHSPFEESFSSPPIDIFGEGYRFHNLMEHESLTREERQFIDEPLPDPIFHQQTNEEPISPTEPGPSFVVDGQKTSNLVEGNDGNNAYQLLYETFGPIPSREGKNKRLSQELRNQIEHALTMPDIKQSQIATFFGVSSCLVSNIYLKQLAEGDAQNHTYQVLYKEFGEISRKREKRGLSQKLREQITHALTLPNLSQRQIAAFFGVSNFTVNNIYQKHFEEDYDEKMNHQLFHGKFGKISREKNQRIPQKLRNQIEEALTIPYTKQKHVATFFGVSLTTVKEIKQKVKRSKQLADIAKPVASRSSPTLSSNQTDER